jgi:Uma2 family endonuclease
MPRTNGWTTLADLLHDLGDVAPERVRARPSLGTATEADLIRIQTHEDRHCELIDGILVEKVMSYPESCLTSDLCFALKSYLQTNDLGCLTLPDGPTRLREGLVRLPDVSFISWKKLPRKEYPTTPILDVVPDLAVEILSEGNTRGEMQRKRKEYFLAGVELVWEIDPFKRTVVVYTSPDDVTTLTESDTLDGGAVLPGFSLPLKQLFARLPRDRGKRTAKPKKSK